MKIKDYKCKCEHDDFFFASKGSQKGIYCSYCGKWLKWADKDEQNLVIKPKEKTGWIPVSERLPEKGKQVLCCNKQGSVFTSAITYKNASMVAFGQHCDVIAWMPLPKPYEPQESEE